MSSESKVITDLELVARFNNLKKSARDRGIAFEISLTKLKRLMKAKTCYYTGVAFVANDPLLCLSIDRVESDVGYIDSNIVACTARINSIKGNMSLNELELICKGVKKFHQSKKVAEKRKLSKTKKDL